MTAPKHALLVGLILLLLPLTVYAQLPTPPPSSPLIDGVTFGLGLDVYHGDIDGNPTHHAARYLGAGRFGIMVGIDKRLGPSTLGMELHYTHVTANNSQFGITNHVGGLDLLGSYGFANGFMRPFLSVGPVLLAPSYTLYAEQRPPGYQPLGTRVLLTVAGGLILDDHIRLGLRFFPTDYLDGTSGNGGQFDYLSFVTLSYRFDLNRVR